MKGLLCGGFPVGSILGIRLKVHWTLIALLLYFGRSLDPMTTALLVALVVTILTHELGHCVAARMVGGETHEILLWPLGGLAFIVGGMDTPAKWLWVTLAGPLTHVPIAWSCANLLASAGFPLGLDDLNPVGAFHLPMSGEPWHLFLYLVFKLQVLLFCFNVFLPAYPMDGGRLLVGLLARRLPLRWTLAIAGGVSLLVALLMFQADMPIFAMWLAFEAVGLATADMQWHPIAQLYNCGSGQIELSSSVYVAPGQELSACPQCARPMHPRAEQCVNCNWKA